MGFLKTIRSAKAARSSVDVVTLQTAMTSSPGQTGTATTPKTLVQIGPVMARAPRLLAIMIELAAARSQHIGVRPMARAGARRATYKALVATGSFIALP